MTYKYIILVFIMINLLGAINVIVDKSRAKRNQWRIRERTLWLIALLGGAPITYITMKIVRHKTQHKDFMIIMPILSVIDIALLIYSVILFI